jgi:putative DNA primase/helicase
MSKNNKKSSPDFNDEYLKFGAEVFAERIRDRLNNPKAISDLDKEEGLPKEVDGWIPDEMPADAEPDPENESCAEHRSWQRMMIETRDGYKGCPYNASLILENDDRWEGVLAENTFTGSIDFLRKPPIPTIEAGEIDDTAVAQIHVWMEENYELVMQDGPMRKALTTVAARNRYHPVQDYLNGLPEWDGENRCEAWLFKALGADNEPEEYLAAVGKRFLIGAVARIMNAPGVTKVDNMLVFEGLQGDGKSTMIRELFYPWHGDTPLPLGNKDAYIAIRGCWGYEMAEMDSFRKAESSTAKSFLSSDTDNYRAPFATKTSKYPRQTVLIGTVNHIEYLVDSSGNRRYWPVWASAVNVLWLREFREQLWAEALHRFRAGERWWMDRKLEPDLAQKVEFEQSLREHTDAWEVKVAMWLKSGFVHKTHWTLAELFEHQKVINADIRMVTRAQEMKLAAVLQKLNFKKDRKRVNGKRAYWYQVPDGTGVRPGRPDGDGRGYEEETPNFGRHHGGDDNARH